MKLTAKALPTLPRGTHPDGNNLYLRVHAASRVWVYRDRRGGLDDWQVLGTHPGMTLLEARQRALSMKRGQTATSMTLGQAWAEYYAHLTRRYRRPELVRVRFEADILPELRHRPLRTVTRDEVSRALQKIVDRGAPTAANRTLADIKNLFRYAVERGWLDASPVALLTRRAVGGRETPRERNLDWPEIHTFLALLASPEHNTTPGTRLALYACLATGCRAGEVLDMLHLRTLHLTNTKSGRPHEVPDTTHTRALLRLAARCQMPEDHRVLSHALRRLSCNFTPHDLRRTMASRLSDLGVAPHVIEKMLGHQLTGVMAVYNRATYMPERRAAQILWCRRLAQLRKKPPD